MIGTILVTLFFILLPRHAGATEEALRGLLSEAAEFQGEYAKAIRTQGQIDAVKRDIAGSELALTDALAALKSGAHSDRKSGEPPRPNRCSAPSADEKVVASCNAEAAKLNGWKVELLGRADGQKEYEARLHRERERLSESGVAWERKGKSNKALIDVLDLAFQSWQRRYAALVFKSPPYSRLVSTKDGGTYCRPLPSSGREAILESAQSCLQWLWVSALQNR